MTRVQCPSCESRFRAPEHLEGEEVACPICGAALTVPVAGAASAPRPSARRGWTIVVTALLIFGLVAGAWAVFGGGGTSVVDDDDEPTSLIEGGRSTELLASHTADLGQDIAAMDASLVELEEERDLRKRELRAQLDWLDREDVEVPSADPDVRRLAHAIAVRNEGIEELRAMLGRRRELLAEMETSRDRALVEELVQRYELQDDFWITEEELLKQETAVDSLEALVRLGEVEEALLDGITSEPLQLDDLTLIEDDGSLGALVADVNAGLLHADAASRVGALEEVERRLRETATLLDGIDGAQVDSIRERIEAELEELTRDKSARDRARITKRVELESVAIQALSEDTSPEAVSAILESCERILTDLRPGSDYARNKLTQLEARWSGDLETTRRIRDIRRWGGHPVGHRAEYKGACDQASEALDAGNTDTARVALTKAETLLPDGWELRDLRRRLEQTGALLDEAQAVELRLAAAQGTQLDELIAEARRLHERLPDGAASSALSAAIERAEPRLARDRTQVSHRLKGLEERIDGIVDAPDTADLEALIDVLMSLDEFLGDSRVAEDQVDDARRLAATALRAVRTIAQAEAGFSELVARLAVLAGQAESVPEFRPSLETVTEAALDVVQRAELDVQDGSDRDLLALLEPTSTLPPSRSTTTLEEALTLRLEGQLQALESVGAQMEARARLSAVSSLLGAGVLARLTAQLASGLDESITIHFGADLDHCDILLDGGDMRSAGRELASMQRLYGDDDPRRLLLDLREAHVLRLDGVQERNNWRLAKALYEKSIKAYGEVMTEVSGARGDARDPHGVSTAATAACYRADLHLRLAWWYRERWRQGKSSTDERAWRKHADKANADERFLDSNHADAKTRQGRLLLEYLRGRKRELGF